METKHTCRIYGVNFRTRLVWSVVDVDDDGCAVNELDEGGAYRPRPSVRVSGESVRQTAQRKHNFTILRAMREEKERAT